ncbi:hypothetical protein NPIL_492751 [Nephila pilipes]|uniref:Uncharacterized protein n=1 Tax=Nephila pilipes TaxID=299642 RepID=A0A8X6TG77_NEPPI|nr:hypothetical protein NPIL_492751 [Nephila pilipes]
MGIRVRERRRPCEKKAKRRLLTEVVQFLSTLHTHHLSPSDFYLSGTLKGYVNSNNPHTLEELQQNIENSIAAIPLAQLLRVSSQFNESSTALHRSQWCPFPVFSVMGISALH